MGSVSELPRVAAGERMSSAQLYVQAGSFLKVLLPKAVAFPENSSLQCLGKKEFEARLLERPPFFMVDRAVAIGTDVVLGVVPISAERCAGHFPNRPIVPLIRMCEYAAQTGLVLIGLNTPESNEPIAIGSGDSKAKARKFIEPPVDLLVVAKLVEVRFGASLFIVDAEFYVDGNLVGMLKKIQYMAPTKAHVLTPGT